MNSPIQIVLRLSTAIALATVLAVFAVQGASARIVDDYFRDSTKPVLHTGGSIVDPAVRNRLVDDSFRDSTRPALPAGVAIIDSPVRNRLVDDSFRNAGGDAAAMRALMLRSEALNRKYHLGRYAVAAGGSGSGWSDVRIGTAAMLGLLLFTGGAALLVRRRWPLAHA
jgi:hypothetical protein